jgi:hypothetical protein
MSSKVNRGEPPCLAQRISSMTTKTAHAGRAPCVPPAFGPAMAPS